MMKIESISITKLFGTFDYNIPLNKKDRITIIHGPNGYGKTVLLTLIHDLFNLNFLKLIDIPFLDMVINFHNGDHLKIINSLDQIIKENEKKELVIEYYPLKKPSVIYKATSPNKKGIVPKDEKENLPIEIKELLESININFIETQRTGDKKIIDKKQSMLNPAEISFHQPMMKFYANELARTINKKLAEYGALSQSLDRSYPARLFNKDARNGSTQESLKEQLKELEAKRNHLVDVGILDASLDMDFKELPQEIDENNLTALSVYVRDSQEKLKVFDELTEKIDLFVKIINDLFLFKKLSINKEKGFIFKTESGTDLPAKKLSSGEQHEIVLLYEMLFEVKPNTLILIDEPELSLHVIWQRKFLEDLQKITRLAGFDVLIATHSPQIINDRWDLTIELEGPAREE